MKYKILIIDDEKIVRNSLKRMLSSDEWDITTSQGISEARELLNDSRYDLVIVDYKLDDGNGMEIIEYVNEVYPEIPTIMLTAYGNISLAVDAVKKGASDFLEKESDPDLLRHTINQALEKVRLRKEVEALQHERFGGKPLESLVAVSEEMQEVLDVSRECARCDATILIDGETGTGKSVLAEHIHQASERRDKPFVTINCGSIPTELIESELFGYEKGAFTGASKAGKTGLIEKADGGTLFLDEIGNLPLGMQAKLLFVLEKGEFLRVGAVESTQVDVRFIAATNAELEKKIDAGEFRSDLYYRLNIAHITIPPLREHPSDIIPLTKQFLHELNQKFGKSVTQISDGARERLLAYAYPGNVRELKNVLERVMILKSGDTLKESDLQMLNGGKIKINKDGAISLDVKLETSENVLKTVTKDLVKRAWELSEQNQTQTAKLLGMPRTTLQHYLQKYDLV